MKKTVSIIFNLTVAMSMLLSLQASQPAVVKASAPALQAPQPPQPGTKPVDKLAAMPEPFEAKDPILKIDPTLREAVQAFSQDPVEVFVTVRVGVKLDGMLQGMIARPSVFKGLQTIYGQTSYAGLLKIANTPGVISIANGGLKQLDRPIDPEKEGIPDQAANLARLDALKAHELTYAEAQAQAPDVSAQGWFDVQDGHKSAQAWKKGFDGSGVIVAVIDDGIDFGHPDLQGTAARVTDPESPYFGWPMAFSDAATTYFVNDVFFGTDFIATGATASRWSDTRTDVVVDAPFGGGTGTAMFRPLGSSVTYEYIFNATSASNHYKLGSFPDENLEALYGHRVAVLVVDENAPGVYDTVYVDLDNDHDFTDEKPATQDSPEVYRDMDGDGFADISGGMIAWISDGENPPPVVDWLWGVSCADSSATMDGCPGAGTLVIFAGALAGGYTHGTQCASNVAGQGIVSDGLSAQPFRIGGMVQGAAPNVGLFDMGTFYQSFYDEDHYLVAALGYDGIPYSGDEAQVATNSYGSFTQMWGSWGPTGRLLTAINLTFGENTTFIFSAGNEGPGYGPQEGDGSPTTIQVGSSTQYGSTNWDSIFNADQIMYGDPNSFFAKGPNRDGSSGLDVLANGGRGAGDEGINYYGFNGAESWATWGGTSRSGPVAGGNLALVYQAYKARYGEWPTWEMAKTLLKSGADNSVSSPFFQGGGVVNADRATDLAAGIYGVYATPDEWQVGDWKGVEYLNFAKVAVPGETYTKTYTVYNPSGYNIDVDLSKGVMTKIGSDEYSLTTASESVESPFNFHSPDYLMKLDPATIPADAELMVVRYVHPYDTFDPEYTFDGSPDSSWRFMLYNWTDMNGDGNLWKDTDGNGAVNHVGNGEFDNDGFERIDFSQSEIQEGEYVRVDYEFGGLAIPVAVRDPLARMGDSYFFGFQHRNNNHTVDHTTFEIGVEFYKRADWTWLNLSESSLSLPAESLATFDAVASIPADTAPGAYEGVIFMNDPGDYNHPAHETALPVVVNVIADLPDNGSVMLGGRPMANTLYQNSWTNGYFNWYGGGWTGAGDWRHYFLNLNEGDVANDNLLLHTSWNDGYPTDINTWLLGPTADCASNGADCTFFEDITGILPDADIFGPYTLWPIASSGPFLAGSAYPFETSTGGPDDWVKAPLASEGLYEVALHNVEYSGEDLAAQFQVDVGTLDFSASMDPDVGSVSIGSVDADIYTDTGKIDLEFTPSIAIPDLNASLSGGLVTDVTNDSTFLVDSGQCGNPWCANVVFEPIMVTQTGTTRLRIFVSVPTAQDVDAYLIYDSNNNGVAEQGTDPIVAASTGSAGADEEMIRNNPTLGRYFLALEAWDVTPDSGISVDWFYQITHPDPLPTQVSEVYNNVVSISQDDLFDPITSSYSMTLVTDERSAALHADLTGIPAGSDVDLYLYDENGDLVTKSQTTGNVDEGIDLLPDLGEYRLGEGHSYTLYVHGFTVPAGPITPNLHVWWDVVNMWLSAGDPDVHVNAIGAGETVTVTLNFEKKGMLIGESLGGRLVVGSSALATLFDEQVTLNRTDPPVVTGPMAMWDVSKTASSARGEAPVIFVSPFDDPHKNALVAPGELITYTVTVTNNGDAPGTFYMEDYWGDTRFDFHSWVATPAYYGFYTAAGWENVWITDTLGVGESASFSFVNQATGVILGSGSLNYADVYDNDTFDFWDEDYFIGYYRTFSTSATTGLPAVSAKWSSPEAVVAGETYSYTIELINPSSVDTPLFVSDVLPAEVEFISAPDMDYDAGSHTVSWSGTVPGNANQGVDLEVVVKAADDLEEGTEILNTATVAFKFDGTPFAFLDATTLVDNGLNPDLTLSKSVDQLIGVVGSTLGYTIVIANTGDDTAFGVEVLDAIPSMLDVDEASITGGAVITDGQLSWTGDLAAGASHTITFRATLNDTATLGYAVINAAEAQAQNVASGVFNSAVTEVTGMLNIYMPEIHK